MRDLAPPEPHLHVAPHISDAGRVVVKCQTRNYVSVIKELAAGRLARSPGGRAIDAVQRAAAARLPRAAPEPRRPAHREHTAPAISSTLPGDRNRRTGGSQSISKCAREIGRTVSQFLNVHGLVGLAAATAAVAKSGGNQKPSAGHAFRSLGPPGRSSAPP